MRPFSATLSLYTHAFAATRASSLLWAKEQGVIEKQLAQENKAGVGRWGERKAEPERAG
jgi:hypothetical protein